jgi:hypothetical protein
MPDSMCGLAAGQNRLGFLSLLSHTIIAHSQIICNRMLSRFFGEKDLRQACPGISQKRRGRWAKATRGCPANDKNAGLNTLALIDSA